MTRWLRMTYGRDIIRDALRRGPVPTWHRCRRGRLWHKRNPRVEWVPVALGAKP